MSDRVGLKPKDNVGKKFSSLNLNQTYKGTKVEPKPTTGIPRHGLQSLGKVAASRRMPPPANLPSLKSENLGNDPTVALVPSGGGGWGSGKEKEANTTIPTTAVPAQSTAQGTSPGSQQQAQQPLKPTETSQKPASTTGQQTTTGQTTTNQTSGTSTKTWASSSNVAGGPEKTSYPHQSQYFNREFPTLGGGNSGDRQQEERVSHPPYGQPPRNMHDPPWMDKGGTGPPPRPSFGMYNGAPYQGPPQRSGYESQVHHRDGYPASNYSRPEGSGTFPYMGQTRPTNHSGHSTGSRGSPGPRHVGSMGRHMIRMEDSPSGYARPSILKEDDIRAMDDEDLDDDGWAGAQEEIDYSVKLNFDDDEPTSPAGEKNNKDERTGEKSEVSRREEEKTMHPDESRAQEGNKGPAAPKQAESRPIHGESHLNHQQQWQEPGKQVPYHSQRAWSGGHHQQPRTSFPTGTQSGAPPAGGWYQQDGRRMGNRGPEGLDRSRIKEQQRMVIEEARRRKEEEELERKRHQEAAAQEKLKQLDAAKNRQSSVQTHDISTRDKAGPEELDRSRTKEQRIAIDQARHRKEKEELERKQQETTAQDKTKIMDATKNRQPGIQTHDSSIKDQIGPRSPLSPAGSDTQVRRIMRRKDSSSTGEDDASVKSVESVGKQEKSDSRRSESQAKETRERLRKTSSSDLQVEGKASRLKSIKEEQKTAESAKSPKEKPEEKTSVEKDTRQRKTSGEKQPTVKSGKQIRQSTDVEPQRRKPGDGSLELKSAHESKELEVAPTDRRDSKKRADEPEHKREGSDRKSSEVLRRREESSRKKDPVDSKKETSERRKDEFENRKENVDKRSDYPETRNERGSSELLRSKDGLDRRKEDRKRSEDTIKRKRDDFERNEPFNERGNRDRGHNKDRFYSSRARPHLGGKVSLRGHPKSYSHSRTDRKGTQRRTSQRTRKDSRDYAEDDMGKNVSAGEKSQVTERGEEMRQSDGDRRRRGHFDDSRSFVDKRADRQSREDIPYRGSSRFPPRTTQERPGADRGADRGRDKPVKVRSGGFGVPTPKQPEQTKEDPLKDKSEESSKTKGEPRVGGEAKPFVSSSSTGSSKTEEKEAKTSDTVQSMESRKVDQRSKTEQRKDEERSHFTPPASNAWDKGGVKETSKATKSDHDERQTSERQVSAAETKDGSRTVSMGAAKDTRRDRKTSGRVGFDRQGTGKRDTAAERERVESRNEGKPSSVKDSKISEQDAKVGERNERTELKSTTRREQDSKGSRGFPRGDFRGSKTEEKLARTEALYESRRNERRDRTGARDDSRRERESKTDERRSRVEPRGESRREQESRSDERRYRSAPRDDSRRDQGFKSDEQRGRMEPRGESGKEQESETDDRRDRTERRDNLRRGQESKGEERGNRSEPQREFHQQHDSKTEERDRTEPPRESRRNQELKAEDRNDKTERGESRGEFAATSKLEERFTIGSTTSESQGMSRGRYVELRRGNRRGGRGPRGSRGRGRGRQYGSGRIPGRSSTASKDEEDDDSDDSGKYHSAYSSVDDGSDDSDAEELPKQDDAYKDGHSGRTQPFGRGTRQPSGATRPRGRGRGSSPKSSRPSRKLAERPPRFQKQEQSRGASRGRGKGGRGQQSEFSISPKENWDDNKGSGKSSEKRKELEEGPLPKKRPPRDLQDSPLSGEGGAAGLKNRKSVRSGQSNKKSSFLAKKQQEVVEGARKGSSRSSAGPKSTFPAALTHGRSERRGKNDSAPDLDEIPEPPKKNPRRLEPPKMGIDHIDLSNIASFIDIDDIVQPASEPEPASPQSGFVEVKSKRSQKEQRERAREEEERKRRETEKMMADALLKPKTHKSTNLNKSHQTSKPPRFARNNATSNQMTSVTRVNTPPGTVPPAVESPESSMVSGIPLGSSEQKQASTLMVEKLAPPPPPPMFNAWTKPLSITPAKPQMVSVEVSAAMQPDPLAVGSGKPTRPSGIQPKAEEPELKIQVTLPDTFQSMPTERNMEAQTTGNSDDLVEDSEVKKRVDSDISPNKKTDIKNSVRTTESTVNNEKNSSVNEKRHGGNKFPRPPRFEKATSVKRNVDGRKPKADVKEHSNETKPQRSAGDAEKVSKENDHIPSSGPRSSDLNKNQKPTSQIKAEKSPNACDAGGRVEEKNSQPREKPPNDGLKSLNKRDSAELDVHSMSESLLDETPLGVSIVETSKSASGTPSMDKVKTEDDIQKEYEMEEKMVAAKKAWDDTSASMTVKWTKPVSVSAGDSTESNEGSVMEQITGPSSEVEESAEPLASSPSSRLKKSTNGEQQNVCKVKPQQQQQPVKPQQVPSDIPEEFPTSTNISMSRMDVQSQTNYPVAQTTVFSSKVTPQYALSYEQKPILQFPQYVQSSNIAPVQHASPVRPQAVHTTSHSPPQRSTNFPQGQSMSTPSPLSHQTVLQDSYRPVMQGALYSTSSYPNNQYFQIPVVRQTTPPQSYQAPANDEVSSSVYTLQRSKSQSPGHGYEQAIATGQPVLLSVDQQYLNHTQSQRQILSGYYPNNTNQQNVTQVAGNISHVQATVAYSQNDKHMPQHRRESHANHHDQQVHPSSGQSEMVKHVNAKPFQPPANTPSPNVTNQILAPNHHMTAVQGPTSVSPGYHVNNVVVSMQASSSSSAHSGTSSVVAQPHSIPVSRLSFSPYPSAVGSYQRQVPVPVQSLTQAPYPAGLTYRTPVASYTSSNVGSQTGMIVQKSYPAVVRPLLPPGRASPIGPRMPEPIQRPTKPGMLSGSPKEKLANQPRPKAAYQSFSRRNFNPTRGAPSQIIPHQLQTPPRQQQQQQTFRNQQHQLMLSGVQQFFAEDKEIELQHHRKHHQAHQKPDLPTMGSEGHQKTNQDKRKQQTKIQPETSETKPQKSTRKDEHKKPEYKHDKRNRQQDRKEVRTAQIQPQRSQARSQNRSKPGAPKQESTKTVEQLSAIEPSKTEPKPLEKIETRAELQEPQTEVVSTPLVS